MKKGFLIFRFGFLWSRTNSKNKKGFSQKIPQNFSRENSPFFKKSQKLAKKPCFFRRAKKAPQTVFLRLIGGGGGNFKFLLGGRPPTRYKLKKLFRGAGGGFSKNHSFLNKGDFCLFLLGEITKAQFGRKYNTGAYFFSGHVGFSKLLWGKKIAKKKAPKIFFRREPTHNYFLKLLKRITPSGGLFLYKKKIFGGTKSKFAGFHFFQKTKKFPFWGKKNK